MFQMANRMAGHSDNFNHTVFANCHVMSVQPISFSGHKIVSVSTNNLEWFFF